MNIIKSIQTRWRNGQKGAVLVLTALLLPTFVALTGFAVDGGNYYYQRSRMQNAADAAALAGANEYVNQIKKDPKSSQNTLRYWADRVAKRYVNGAYHNLEKDEDVDISTDLKSGSKSSGTSAAAVTTNNTYYTVTLEKDVPLHFLAYFLGDTYRASVHSNAKILTTATNTEKSFSGPLPPYLFVFKKKLYNVNSIENPDTLDKKGQIITTFDGKVIYTDPNYNPSIEYSTQRHDLAALFTDRARKEGLSVNEALAHGQSVYDPDTGKDTANGYWSSATRNSYDYNSFPEWIQHSFIDSKNYDSYDQNYQSLNVQAIEKTTNHLQKYDSGNINITIDKEIQGDINTPVIIQTPEHGSVININLNADTRRPVFIYCPGGSDSEQTMQVHMNLNGHTFRGVVWAPFINDEGVLINANGGTYSGSIIASSINLQGGKGTFKYENFFDSGSGSGSGSGSSSSTSSTTTYNVALVSDRDMV